MALSIFVSSLIFALPAIAADKADLLVGMKILPLLAEKVTGPTTFAVIFDPANISSRHDAEGVKALLNGNFATPGDVKLIPVLVPVNNLVLLADSKIALLADGLSNYYEEIGRVAASKGILTMSTDLACVKADKCVIGIVSKPDVDIYYSKAAMDASHIVFSQIFTLLAKQI